MNKLKRKARRVLRKAQRAQNANAKAYMCDLVREGGRYGMLVHKPAYKWMHAIFHGLSLHAWSYRKADLDLCTYSLESFRIKMLPQLMYWFGKGMRPEVAAGIVLKRYLKWVEEQDAQRN